MRYLIKSQREDCYFKEFNRNSKKACFGKIQEAKIFNDKYSALRDLKKMDSCGQRIVAVTRVGRSQFEYTNQAEKI